MRTIIAIFLALILYAAGVICHRYYLHQPKINPNPKIFLTVNGTVNKETNIDAIGLAFETTNKACNKTVDYVEGADAPRRIFLSFPLKKSYNVKLPLDHLRPGFCGWEVASLYYRNKMGANNFIIGFNDKGKKGFSVDTAFAGKSKAVRELRRGVINFKCDPHGICYLGRELDFSPLTMISAKISQNLQMNFAQGWV